jgi:hypothetical protein
MGRGFMLVAVMKLLTLGVSIVARSHGPSGFWTPPLRAGVKGTVNAVEVIEAAIAGTRAIAAPIVRARMAGFGNGAAA